MKFDILLCFENASRKFKFHKSRTKVTGTLLEGKYTFLITSRSVLLRMRNVADKSCRENQNTHFISNNCFSRKSCRSDNVDKYGNAGEDTDHNITRRMRFACWMTKATDTHSEYAIFPLQQWFCQHAAMLRYTYIACLVTVTLGHATQGDVFH